MSLGSANSRVMSLQASNRVHYNGRPVLQGWRGTWVGSKPVGLLLALAVLLICLTQLGCTGSTSATSTTSSPTKASSAPTITVQPASQAVTAGQTVTFSVTASGTAPLTYQWQNNGTPVTGAVSSAYMIPHATTSESGTLFTVAVSNSLGSATSTAATLTVNTPAVAIIISPSGATLTAGSNQQFVANVTETSNTAVTWTVTGAACAGDACGTISSNGLYVSPASVPSPVIVGVNATSVADPTKSASASITIVPTVVVTVTPANVSVSAGSSQQFTASVAGTSNTAVDWTVSGTGCSGAACGTINSSGLYIAPAAIPSPDTVTVTAASVTNSGKSASAKITIESAPSESVTYFLAPAADGGSDSNSGTSIDSPWLTPNHYVNCGDVIIAAASTSYVATNFTYGKWGTVTCPEGNNVAWLKCVTFDACKFTANGSYVAMAVTESYWGVQGWEVTSIGETDACFTAYPAAGVEIHHIIFANDIANGCYLSGFQSGNNGDAGIDYLVVVGTITYNASQTSVACASGIDIYQPVQSDSLPGTHIYIAGNFSWANFDANPCAGGAPSDGEGVILDTLDGSQGGLPSPYAAQVVVDNNILIANGGRGFQVFNNSAGSAHAAIYVRHNTVWGNNGDLKETNNLCGEMLISASLNVQEFFNIAATNATKGCGGYPLYAYYVANGGPADLVYDDIGYSATDTDSDIKDSTGFSYGPNNLFGTDPSFANATAPEAPSCSNASSVPNCMAKVIADFTPTASGSTGYGYQIPNAASVSDPLFPKWLCNVNLPPGLVTMGCL